MANFGIGTLALIPYHPQRCLHALKQIGSVDTPRIGDPPGNAAEAKFGVSPNQFARIRTVRHVMLTIALSKPIDEADMTKHPQSEQSGEGLSRRGLVQALAAGAAAASIATPAAAQQQMTVLAEATSADYGR